MSSFFRGIFGKKKALQEESGLDVQNLPASFNKSTPDESWVAPLEFRNVTLQSLWVQYETEANESEQIDDYFSSIVDGLIDGARESVIRKNHTTPTNNRKSIHEVSSNAIETAMTGHPAAFVALLWKTLQQLLTSQFLSVDALETARDPTADREEVIQLLRCLNYLITFPINVFTLRNQCGGDISKVLLLVGSACLDEVESYFHNSNSRNLTSEYIDYVLKIQVLLLEIISQILSCCKSSNFVDFTGSQPWTFIGIEAIEQCDSPLTTWPNIDNDGGYVWNTGSVDAEQADAVRMVFMEDFIEVGYFDFFFRLANVTNNIPIATISESALLLVSIIQASWLHCFLTVLSDHPELLPTTIQQPGFTLSTLISHLISQPVYSTRCFIVQTRVMLLIMRIYSFISNLTDVEIPILQFFRVDPVLIAELAVHYNQVVLTLPFHVEVPIASTETFTASFEYTPNIGQAQIGHDLWPWNHPQSFIGSLLENISSTDDFHILRPVSTQMMHKSTKQHPGYLLWDSVVSEILGSRMLSQAKPMQSTKASKVQRSKVHALFQVFHEVYRNRKFLEMQSATLYFPFMQLKFVDFICELFKAAEATDIFAVLSEFDAFSLLLGNAFLMPYRDIFNDAAQCFEEIVFDCPERKKHKIIFRGINSELNNHYFAGWYYLHDTVMDYFHGLVIYSLYFQSSKDSLDTFLGYDDIILVLVQFVQSLLRENEDAYNIIFEISRLTINLNDIVSSMVVNGSKHSRDKIIYHILEAIEVFHVNETANYWEEGSIRSKMSKAASSALTELLMQIILSNSRSDNDWIDAFALKPEEVYFDFAEEVMQLSGHVTGNGSRLTRANSSATDAYTLGSSKPIMMRDRRSQSRVTDDGREKLSKARRTVMPILYLLLDPDHYIAALQLVQSMVMACANMINALDSNANDSNNDKIRTQKQGLRSLAADAVNIILGFVGVCHKHADPVFSIQLALHCINILTVLMRDDTLVSIRIHVQEIFRRENLLYELLRAIARSLNGFDIIRQRKDQSLLPSNHQELIVSLLRSGISLLASVACGNEACKIALNTLVQGNREKISTTRIKHFTVMAEKKSSQSLAVYARSASGLASLVLCGERSPAMETLVVVFDFLLDGPFAGTSYQDSDGNKKKVSSLFRNDDDRPRLKNTAILIEIVNLIPYCEESVQKFCIKSLINLVSGRACLINLGACTTSRPKLIDSMLDVMAYIPDTVQSAAAELIELLGRNNITVASLKHLFRVLQFQEGQKPAFAWKIVQALQGMFLQEHGPKHAFVFAGNNSGLKLPTIYRWPTMKGLSFCCWIRIESPKLAYENTSSDQVSEVYSPHVFCLRDKSGCGIELYLKQSGHPNQFRLVFKSHSEAVESSTFSPEIDEMKLEEGRWYFIAVCISSAKFYTKGEATICVDRVIETQECKLPKLPQFIPEPLIGDCIAEVKQNRHHHTLRGQMGAMYFFHESLSRSHLQLIYVLGPDYLYNFEPVNSVEKVSSNSTSSQHQQQQHQLHKMSLLEEAQLTKRIMLSYNPVVLRGKYFLDNTPERNDMRWKVPLDADLPEEIRTDVSKYCSMHAMKLPGTYRSTHQDVRLAMNSLGGIKAIIPLFALIDKPAATVVATPMPPNSSPSSSSTVPVSVRAVYDEQQEQQEALYEPNFFPAVLGLFNTMLSDSQTNLQVFSKAGGFACIKTLLERASSENFNLITFHLFVALYASLTEEYLLQDSLLENIFCNFKLWISSPVDVLLCLMDWLVSIYREDPNCNPASLSIQRLVDSLYQLFDYELAAPLAPPVAGSPSRSSQGSESVSRNASHDYISSFASAAVVTANTTSPIASPSSAQVSSGVSFFPVSATSFKQDKLIALRSRVFSLMKIAMIKRTSSLFEDIAAIVRYLCLASTQLAKRECLLYLIDILTNSDLKKKLPSILVGLIFNNSLLYLNEVFKTADDCNKALIMLVLGLFIFELTNAWHETCALAIKIHAEIVAGALPSKSISIDDLDNSRSDRRAQHGLRSDKSQQQAITSQKDFMEGSGATYAITTLLTSVLSVYEQDDAEPFLRLATVMKYMLDLFKGKYPSKLLDEMVSREYIPASYDNCDSHNNVGGSSPKGGPGSKEMSSYYSFIYFIILKGVSYTQLSLLDKSDVLRSLEAISSSHNMTVQLLSSNVSGGWQRSMISSLQRLFSPTVLEESMELQLEVLSHSIRILSYFIRSIFRSWQANSSTDSSSSHGELIIYRDLLAAVVSTAEIGSFLSLTIIFIGLFSSREIYSSSVSSKRAASAGGNTVAVKLDFHHAMSILAREHITRVVKSIATTSTSTSPGTSMYQQLSQTYGWIAGFLAFTTTSGNVQDQGEVIMQTIQTYIDPLLLLDDSSNSGYRRETLRNDMCFSGILTFDSWCSQPDGIDSSSVRIMKMALNNTWQGIHIITAFLSSLPISTALSHESWVSCLHFLDVMLGKLMQASDRLGRFEVVHVLCILTRVLCQQPLLSSDIIPFLTKYLQVSNISSLFQQLIQAQEGNQELVPYFEDMLAAVIEPSNFRNFARYSSDDASSSVVSEGVHVIEAIQQEVVALFYTQQTTTATQQQCYITIQNIIHYVLSIVDFMEEEVVYVQILESGLGDMVVDLTQPVTTAAAVLAASSADANDDNVSSHKGSSKESELVKVLSSYESNRLKESLRHIDNNNKRCESKWNRIFSQLANERGSWGYGNEHHREVYWTLDNTLNDTHLKYRLRRNPVGSKHMIASMKSIGIENVDQQQAAILMETEDTRLGIYADLKKYKKQSVVASSGNNNGRDNSADNDNELDNDDDPIAAAAGGSTNNLTSATGGLLSSDSSSDAFSASVEVISIATNPSGGRTTGKLEINKFKVSFFRAAEYKDYDFVNKTGNAEFMWACQCYPSTTWMAQDVIEVYRRRYQLRNVAIELFFANRTSVLINLFTKKAAKKAYNFLISTKFRSHAKYMNNLFFGLPDTAVSRVTLHGGINLQQAWVLRKISNFEYLNYLNFIAGRTFNDLAQYPVFPWVLSDYTSSKLDLRDKRVYRDLEKPIGAQLPHQRLLLIEKYESSKQLFEDDSMMPYHCGSHYSTSAMVLWYLMRMEPFTSLHVWLQDGKFDRPDRLFYSLEHAYLGSTTNTQDVKELIPEFYFNPEFLYNTNSCKFGIKQTGEVLDDVKLPAWCKDGAEFIRIHRDALESEYVSAHLHSWIDMIFGSKQRPPHLAGGNEKSEEACNIFIHLSYPDAVDLEEMKDNDPALYERTIRQIDCYGQTPIQLFTKDHPQRKRLEDVHDLIWPIASCVPGADTYTLPENNTASSAAEASSAAASALDKPSKILCYGDFKVSSYPLIFLGDCSNLNERLITIDSARILGCHAFQMRQPDNIPPYMLKLDKVAVNQALGHSVNTTSSSSTTSRSNKSFSSYLQGTAREKIVGIPFAAPGVLSSSVLDRNNMQQETLSEHLGTRKNRNAYLEEETRRIQQASAAAAGGNNGNNMAHSASFSVSRRALDRNTSSSVRGSSNMMPPSMQSPTVVTNAHASNSSTPFDKKRSSSNLDSTMSTMDNSSSPMRNTNQMIDQSMTMRGTSTGGYLPNDSPVSNTGPRGTIGKRMSTIIKARERIDEHLGPHLFSLLMLSSTAKFVVSAGHWDNTFKVTALDNGRLVQSISHHREVVTCIATASDHGRHWVVAGSKDCTLTIWEAFAERESDPIGATPLHTLYGHDDAVNCCVINPALDIILSGSDDGTIIVHSLREGLYLRSITFASAAMSSTPSAAGASSMMKVSMSTSNLSALTSAMSSSAKLPTSPVSPRAGSQPPQAPPQQQQSAQQPQQWDSSRTLRRVHLLAITPEGTILAYSLDGCILGAYTLNGRFLKVVWVRECLYCFCISEDGRVLLTGGERGLVVMRWTHSLALANGGARRGLEFVIDGSTEKGFEPFPSAIRSMVMTNKERHLLVGLETGELRILAQDSEYLQRKLHRRLMEIGILPN